RCGRPAPRGWPRSHSPARAAAPRARAGGRRMGAPAAEPRRGGSVRIEVRGRNVAVTDEIRDHVEKRFARVGRQVSPLARLEVELSEERNPAIADRHVAEATLHLKGVTLRAREASPEMLHSIHVLA